MVLKHPTKDKLIKAKVDVGKNVGKMSQKVSLIQMKVK